ncbi:hypothetical protein [Pseudoduganella sp. R-34]|uniref:hypothetical protein n=1 Tax=unclassified Pseudoduganella TaxID=2637179 RepID=UPI003CEBB876
MDRDLPLAAPVCHSLLTSLRLGQPSHDCYRCGELILSALSGGRLCVAFAEKKMTLADAQRLMQRQFEAPERHGEAQLVLDRLGRFGLIVRLTADGGSDEARLRATLRPALRLLAG